MENQFRLTLEDFAAVKKQLHLQKKMIVRIVSGSMEPLIKTGENIELEEFASFAQLKRFDVIVFYYRNTLICHFLWHVNDVIKRDGKTILVTRPLARNGEDFPVTEDMVLGWIPSKQMTFFQKLKATLRFIIST